jgi:hypothetical protein
MSDKTVKSVSIDEDAAEFLSEQDNASALVEDLVNQYRQHGMGREMAALKLRRKQKARELEKARENVERLQADLAEIDALIEDAQNAQDGTLEEAIDAVETIETEDLTRDNPAVDHWAEQTGMTPTAFIDAVKEARNK